MNKPGRSDGIIRLPIIDKPFYLNGVLSIQLASPCNIGRSFSPVNADRSGMTCDKVDFPVPRRYEVSADWICVPTYKLGIFVVEKIWALFREIFDRSNGREHSKESFQFLLFL